MIRRNGFNRPVVLSSSFDQVSAADVSTEETAEWKGIIARATVLDVRTNSTVLIVPAARGVLPRPTMHDILHAQVTQYVFEQRRGESKWGVFLADRMQRLARVPQPETAFADFLGRYESEGLRNFLHGQRIPAPLVGFLFRQRLKMR